ncbi:MAG: ABC transporter ATP-binding protein [Bacteriovoracales bacterium]
MYSNLLKGLWPYIKPHKKKAFASLFFALVLAGLKWAEAALVKPVFDKGLSANGSIHEVLVIAGLLVLIMILNFPARFLHFYWIRYIVDKSTCEMRTNLYAKIQKLPMWHFQQRKQGVLVSTVVNDTITFSYGFRAAMDLIREPLYAIVLLGLAIYRDWQLTLVILITAPLFILIFSKSGKSVKKNQGTVQEELGNLTHNISEGLSGQKIAKAFNLQDYLLKRFNETQNKYFNYTMKTTWAEEMAHPLVEFVGGLAFAGVLVFAQYRIRSGALTTGDFVSFVTAMALIMDPLRKLSAANIKLAQAEAAEKRIASIFAQEEEIDEGSLSQINFSDKIEINNLSFSYGEGNVLKNLSLEIKKGQKIALVGLSGSGKSTLINILLGLYKTKPGTIKIDGVDINDIKLKTLRGLFGLVSQDIFLFHDTVRENLTLGKEIEEERIEDALQVAYASDFLEKLNHKWDTVIGERGVRLSGGQQQRITIARAFLQNTPILLFDEATSSLDNESERMVQKALDRLSREKTVFAVAHRLSTISDFDMIYVLNRGQVVEQGTHHQLMAHKNEYFKLYGLGQKMEGAINV